MMIIIMSITIIMMIIMLVMGIIMMIGRRRSAGAKDRALVAAERS